jgi:hypothetical protein
VSAKGDWQTVHADLKASANSSAELRRPGSVTGTNVSVVLLGPVTRVFLRAKYDPSATLTTSPVVRIIGAWGKISQANLTAGTLPDDASVRYMTIASAQTITIATTTDQRDATFAYSAPHSTTGTDMLGADYLIVLVETAANTSTGAVTCEALVIN